MAPGLIDTTAESNDLSVSARLDGEDLVIDLEWTGSWRNEKNWDAAWIFARIRDGDSEVPIRLRPETNVEDVRAGPAPQVQVSEDGMGAWVYRSESGLPGRNDWQIRIRHDEESGEIAAGRSDRLRIYGIEMVYVPEGPFYAGDGVSKAGFQDAGAGEPVRIGTDEVHLRAAAGRSSNYTDGVLTETGISVDGDGGIKIQSAGRTMENESFPTGYGSFYAMKHELTQGQYVDFLNALVPESAALRVPYLNAFWAKEGKVLKSGHPAYREHGLSIWADSTQGQTLVYRADHPDRACNYLSWSDGVAYADWAGLRPMTELEFEKAARGDLNPVPGEFAWGTLYAESARRVLDAVPHGQREADGNVIYDIAFYFGREVRFGPVRVGLFGETADGRRVSTGASYYGIMDMSGNVEERTVGLTHAKGRAFQGTHGDGRLDVTTAEATNSDWPPPSEHGVIERGGGWLSPYREIRVSHRGVKPYRRGLRAYTDGFRGVRTGPKGGK